YGVPGRRTTVNASRRRMKSTPTPLGTTAANAAVGGLGAYGGCVSTAAYGTAPLVSRTTRRLTPPGRPLKSEGPPLGSSAPNAFNGGRPPPFRLTTTPVAALAAVVTPAYEERETHDELPPRSRPGTGREADREHLEPHPGYYYARRGEIGRAACRER